MMFIIAFVVFLLNLSEVQATTYWASTSGGAASCAAASGAADPGVYRTKAQIIACLASGDTAMFKAGTYTDACADVFCGFGNTPAGSGSGSETKLLCEADQTCILKPSS